MSLLSCTFGSSNGSMPSAAPAMAVAASHLKNSPPNANESARRISMIGAPRFQSRQLFVENGILFAIQLQHNCDAALRQHVDGRGGRRRQREQRPCLLFRCFRPPTVRSSSPARPTWGSTAAPSCHGLRRPLRSTAHLLPELDLRKPPPEAHKPRAWRSLSRALQRCPPLREQRAPVRNTKAPNSALRCPGDCGRYAGNPGLTPGCPDRSRRL